MFTLHKGYYHKIPMESSDHIAVQNTSVKPGNSAHPSVKGCHLQIYGHYEMPCWSSQHYA